MDATVFRWVLVIIAILLAVGIYLFSLHQSRLRKRSAMENFTREEIDSAFIEDEQLRHELDNLNQILRDDDADAVGQIEINPAREAAKTPYALPDPEIYVPPDIARKDEDRLISYHLRHEDFRLITGEEAQAAARDAGLVRNRDNLLEYREDGELLFTVASLSAPGDFAEIESLEFTTLGFNCYVDFDACADPQRAFEALLRKVDELVRALNVKVYKPSQELLTISDVTDIRAELA